MTFTDQFSESNGAPIHYEDRELIASYTLPVSEGDCIRLRFAQATDSPVQGLGISCFDCVVSAATTIAKSMALWTDSAPEEVTLRVSKARAGARLVLHNQWRDAKHGSTMYHLNNAAMHPVLQPDGSVVLNCSDGWGEPDFTDLVVIVSRCA